MVSRAGVWRFRSEGRRARRCGGWLWGDDGASRPGSAGDALVQRDQGSASEFGESDVAAAVDRKVVPQLQARSGNWLRETLSCPSTER